MPSGQITSNSSVEVGFVSRLAENPVAANVHAANKAKRPTGTQHVAHVCLEKTVIPEQGVLKWGERFQ